MFTKKKLKVMWKCPQCGRELKNESQNHRCGVTPATVDEYIAGQPEGVRPLLEKVREAIRRAAPDAVEKISWSMPTFWQGENLIHFAAFKKHLGIYPGDLTLTPFAEKLGEYRHTKGAIQLPYDKPIPYSLIAEVTTFRVLAAKKKTCPKTETKMHSQSSRGGEQ